MSRHYALVVEFDVPDDLQADTTLSTLVDLIHANSPISAQNVTAYSDVSAELIGQAARGGLIAGLAERLHLEPGDYVVVTINTEQADDDDDLQRWTDVAKEAFPDHKVVMVWEGTTITSQAPDAEVSS
jgi:hypothetical protein